MAGCSGGRGRLNMKKVVPADAVLIPPEAKRVFEGIIFDVYQWQQPMFDGSMATFEMLRRPDTVTVIGVTADEILVIDDDQPHTGSRVSFPGGRVNRADASTLAAAKREMREETGYEFNDWRLIKVWQPHTKLEWFIYLYLAWDGRQLGEPDPDAGEKITLKQLDFKTVKDLAITKSGYLGESKTIFETLSSLEELLALPEFTGRDIAAA